MNSWLSCWLQLRLHLSQTQKYQGQNRAPHAIDLSVPESQAMHLETRLAQLDAAINMELWMVCCCCVFPRV